MGMLTSLKKVICDVEIPSVCMYCTTASLQVNARSSVSPNGMYPY